MRSTIAAIGASSSRTGLDGAPQTPERHITAGSSRAKEKRQSVRFDILRDALRWSAPQDEGYCFKGLPHPDEARRAVSKGADTALTVGLVVAAGIVPLRSARSATRPNRIKEGSNCVARGSAPAALSALRRALSSGRGWSSPADDRADRLAVE